MLESVDWGVGEGVQGVGRVTYKIGLINDIKHLARKCPLGVFGVRDGSDSTPDLPRADPRPSPSVARPELTPCSRLDTRGT